MKYFEFRLHTFNGDRAHYTHLWDAVHCFHFTHAKSFGEDLHIRKVAGGKVLSYMCAATVTDLYAKQQQQQSGVLEHSVSVFVQVENHSSLLIIDGADGAAAADASHTAFYFPFLSLTFIRNFAI